LRYGASSAQGGHQLAQIEIKVGLLGLIREAMMIGTPARVFTAIFAIDAIDLPVVGDVSIDAAYAMPTGMLVMSVAPHLM
jgi:hypothetical protein